jgi:hypothetical protein
MLNAAKCMSRIERGQHRGLLFAAESLLHLFQYLVETETGGLLSEFDLDRRQEKPDTLLIEEG